MLISLNCQFPASISDFFFQSFYSNFFCVCLFNKTKKQHDINDIYVSWLEGHQHNQLLFSTTVAQMYDKQMLQVQVYPTQP